MNSLSETELKHQIDIGNYSLKVDQLRQNRCALSSIKYGSGRRNFPNRVQAIPTMYRCIEKYEETHNTEYLLDAMNYLMFEFMYPSIKDARFRPTDSSESAGLVGMSIKEIEEFDK